MGNMNSRHLAEQDALLNNGLSKVKKGKSKRSKTDQSDFYAMAHELGWMSVNEREKKLIELLRWTTYHGRNVVVETALNMRRSRPWVQSTADADMANNTTTTYPDNGWFFYPMEALK